MPPDATSASFAQSKLEFCLQPLIDRKDPSVITNSPQVQNTNRGWSCLVVGLDTYDSSSLVEPTPQPLKYRSNWIISLGVNTNIFETITHKALKIKFHLGNKYTGMAKCSRHCQTLPGGFQINCLSCDAMWLFHTFPQKFILIFGRISCWQQKTSSCDRACCGVYTEFCWICVAKIQSDFTWMSLGISLSSGIFEAQQKRGGRSIC